MLTKSQAHIRFRHAWAAAGHTLDELPFQAIGGVWGSYLALFLIFLALAAQFFVAIAPPFTSDLNDAEGFFKSYLALPVVLLFYVVGYVWKRKTWIKISDIDLDTGRREHDWEAINAYRARLAAGPAYKRWIAAVW